MTDNHHLIVLDELIQGLLAGTFFLLVHNEIHVEEGYRVIDFDHLIGFYFFPDTRDIKVARFIEGNNFKLYKRIKFYDAAQDNK